MSTNPDTPSGARAQIFARIRGNLGVTPDDSARRAAIAARLKS
jgi:hypothetical protein